MPRAKFWPTGAGESCLDRAAGFGNDSTRPNNGHDAVSRTGCINQTIGRVSLWGEASGCRMRLVIACLLIHNPHKENDNETNPDRKSTRLNSSHGYISYAVFCLKKQQTSEKPAQKPQAQTDRALAAHARRLI